MRDLMAVLKALGDENRVRVLLAVQDRELCVCQIVELLGLAQSTVSKHLSILHQARLIDSRKEGRWMFYRAADDDSPVEAREMANVVSRLLARNSQAGEDANRLKEILKMDRDELCKKQSRCRC
jgi:DNA-binding transcriptional ArsR family regulator